MEDDHKESMNDQTLVWIPGHRGTRGHEVVDERAKKHQVNTMKVAYTLLIYLFNTFIKIDSVK